MNSDCSEFCPEVLPTDLEFLEHVGAGHTCEVYRGKCRGTEVAIKQLIMPKHKMVTEETLAREVAIMVLVRHPNIVTFFGIVTQVSPLWIIMEYCAGGTAFELLHRTREVEPTWGQMLKMCLHVAVAMVYLHKFTPCIIHRDLKSLNILLDQPVTGPRDTVLAKVADFGLARVMDTAEPLTLGVGTNKWMAPEMLASHPYDEKVDVYSFAMVLYEITCRKIPFAKCDPMELKRLVLGGARPDLSEMAAECPENMRELITSCWASNPKDRPTFANIVNIINGMGTQTVVVSL